MFSEDRVFFQVGGAIGCTSECPGGKCPVCEPTLALRYQEGDYCGIISDKAGPFRCALALLFLQMHGCIVMHRCICTPRYQNNRYNCYFGKMNWLWCTTLLSRMAFRWSTGSHICNGISFTVSDISGFHCFTESIICILNMYIPRCCYSNPLMYSCFSSRHCHAKLDHTEYLNDCVFDLCAYKGHITALCNSLTSYLTVCQTAGAMVENWRTKQFCRKRNLKAKAQTHSL